MLHRSKASYPDGFIRRKVDLQPSKLPSVLSNDDLAEVAAKHRNQLFARRLRRVSRVMIAATKSGASSAKLRSIRRRRALLQPMLAVRQNATRFAAVTAVVMFAGVSVLMPLLQADNENKLLNLDSATKQLVGETRDDAASYLKYDTETKKYNFAATEQDKTDTYTHTGRNADAYEASIPQKAGEGITVTDTQSKIDVTVTPQFFTTQAKKSDGNNLVYRSGNRQLVYTLKYNGLKEDIIIPNYQGNELQFKFKISLPAGVEARLDQEGNIGIYSSDPTLFGEISFGSDADRARVEKARENGDKNNLVMTIPYPVVKDAKGQEYTNLAKYTLSNKQVEQRSQAGLPDDAPKLGARIRPASS